MAAQTYVVYNSAAPTTAARVAQPTGTAIRTMLQLKPAQKIRIIEWACSFDGFAAAAPGNVELVEFDASHGATMSTAFAAGDVHGWANSAETAQTAGASGVPLNLSTTTSGFATAAVTENSSGGTARTLGNELIAPTNQYWQQMPLGREPEVASGLFLRVRMTFGTTVNTIIKIVFEV